MDYKELLTKYTALLSENNRLLEENRSLKAKLGLKAYDSVKPLTTIETTGHLPNGHLSTDGPTFSNINHASASKLKIQLFMSLFKGRGDVYAERWENKNRTASGYAPVCLNRWRPGICGKPKVSCAKCDHKLYAVIDEQVIEAHLRGAIVAGIYPMLPDETCHFLAMDFDKKDWQDNIATVRKVCTEYDIPLAVERSRSGNGGHVWFFFEDRVSAALARKFGTSLLTFAMNRRHYLPFNSYDRLFPSQDTLPRGGIGNLIALPLQKSARKHSNSEFVDGYFNAYNDQWVFLASIEKISKDRIEQLSAALCRGHELGVLKLDEENKEKPWERSQFRFEKQEFPEQIRIVKANMLYIPKAGIAQRALNHLKRLASFKNPMFYKHQAMRLSTYGHPRVICCADETEAYLCLPRGCENDLHTELAQVGIDVQFVDKTNGGRRIDVAFKGQLRDEQSLALENLLGHDTGILSGTTAFGKTVVAIKLIAERKVNSLILVTRSI